MFVSDGQRRHPIGFRAVSQSAAGRGGRSVLRACADAVGGSMDDREYFLTAAQKAVKEKYPPVSKKYEYLDHTADVQLHSWGDTLEEAFEQIVMAMFGYMTDIETVQPSTTIEVEAEGHDMLSLLYNFMDEWLYQFSAEMFFIPREMKVIHMDRVNYKIRSIGWGEQFDLDKHPQGTEVKAITYSAMQIHEDEEPQIFVIIDI